MCTVFALLASTVVLLVTSGSSPCKIILLETKDGFVIRCTAVLKINSAKNNLPERLKTNEDNVMVSDFEKSKEPPLLNYITGKRYYAPVQKSNESTDSITLFDIRFQEDVPVTCTDGQMPDDNENCVQPA